MPSSVDTRVSTSGRPALSRAVGRLRREGGLWPILLALPGFLVFLMFKYWPIGMGAVTAFQKVDFVNESQWVGLDNFVYGLTDPVIPQALLNTLYYLFLGLAIGYPIPVIAALFAGEMSLRWRRVFSILMYIPAVLPPVVAILLWRFFYVPDGTGLLNSLLGHIGLGPYQWLDSATTVIPSIVLHTTWVGAGSAAVIYLATLTSVNTELYEAAELDGAGIFQRLFHVTLPQIRGILIIQFILTTINVAQMFTQPYILTGGGPDNKSISLLMVIYNYAFKSGDYGTATALSLLLAIVLGFLSIIYFRTRKRLEEEI